MRVQLSRRSRERNRYAYAIYTAHDTYYVDVCDSTTPDQISIIRNNGYRGISNEKISRPPSEVGSLTVTVRVEKWREKKNVFFTLTIGGVARTFLWEAKYVFAESLAQDKTYRVFNSINMDSIVG